MSPSRATSWVLHFRFELAQVSVRGGRISATTQGRGDAGRILIQARDSVEVIDTSAVTRRRSFIEASVESGATGRGGDITIETNRLMVHSGQIVASTSGRGNAGNLTIRANDSVTLVGQVPALSGVDNGLPGGLLARVQSGATGRGGQVAIDAGRLSIRDGGQVSVRTAGAGDAGTLRVNADAIEVSGRSANGRTPSQLNATVDRNSTGQGGNLILKADNLRLTEGGQISARTEGRQRAGNISIQANDSIALDHGAISTASTATTRRSTGRGGDITIQTGTLTMGDRSQISAQSQGRGRAGNITLNASRQLNAIDSTIATSAPNASGGNININRDTAFGAVVLQDSDIITDSKGNGGNINIRGAGTIAFGDSDILAGSIQENGGDISLGRYFGQGQTRLPTSAPFRNDGQPDVNAQGNRTSGEVSTTDTNFIQNSLNELSVDSIDTGTLLSNSCIVRDRQQGSFRITGTDNFPDRPGNANSSPYPTGTIRSIPANESPHSQTDRPWQIGDAIVEPQGVYQLPDGRWTASI